MVLGTRSGLVMLVGVGVCMPDTVFAGAGGMSKEREMSDQQKKAAIREFNLKTPFAGSDLLRSYERLFCVRPLSRGPDQGTNGKTRLGADMAGSAGPGGGGLARTSSGA